MDPLKIEIKFIINKKLNVQNTPLKIRFEKKLTFCIDIIFVDREYFEADVKKSYLCG
jgi:hypothetical protein